MKTIIIYMTSHGCAEKSAGVLKERLGSDVDVCNLKKDTPPDLGIYDTVIIGGSIHAGRVQGKLKKFCAAQAEILEKKRLGLYLCCMETGEKAQKQFDDAYPEGLRKKAIACGLFGGEFNFDKMNFIEKVIVKKVANVTESVSHFHMQAVEDFAKKMI